MNLHGLVSGLIGVINPFETITYNQSSGSETVRSGKRTPEYAASVSIVAQVQPLNAKDLTQVAGLNLQGEFKKFWFNGEAFDTVRKFLKGGDIIVRPKDGTTWLTTQVVEQWPDWCSIIGTLQNG